MEDSIAVLFTTGSTPGMPRSTSLTLVLGSSPKTLGADENILDLVLSSTWTSNPRTGSYFSMASSKLRMSSVLIILPPGFRGFRRVQPQRQGREAGAAAGRPTSLPATIPGQRPPGTGGRPRGPGQELDAHGESVLVRQA